jgi:hypothetical protein
VKFHQVTLSCSGFPIAACVSKSCSVTACDPENCSESWLYECTLEKKTNESKGNLEQKFDVPLETIFRISKCFPRSKQKLHIDFSLEL